MRCETGFVLNLGSEKTRTDSQTLLSFLLTFQLFFASAAFLQHGFSAVKEGSAVASPSQRSLELLVPVPSILPCPTPSSFSTGFAQLRVPYSSVGVAHTQLTRLWDHHSFPSSFNSSPSKTRYSEFHHRFCSPFPSTTSIRHLHPTPADFLPYFPE